MQKADVPQNRAGPGYKMETTKWRQHARIYVHYFAAKHARDGHTT
jgi:hypothetical protein